eukprot:1140355-Pelagomonas_calceolata.AAC.12
MVFSPALSTIQAAGVEQGTDRHVLLVELQEARQIRASLIQHLLKQSGRTETLASDRDSARVASWLSSLNSPVEHLWKHPVTAPLRACWFLGVLAITCNMCAAATLCYNWGLPAACCQSRGGAQLRRGRLLSWLIIASGWLTWLFKPWSCGRRCVCSGCLNQLLHKNTPRNVNPV